MRVGIGGASSPRSLRRLPSTSSTFSSSSSSSSSYRKWLLAFICFFVFLICNVRLFYVLNTVHPHPSSLEHLTSSSPTSSPSSTRRCQLGESSDEDLIDHAWGTNLYSPTSSSLASSSSLSTSSLKLSADSLPMWKELSKDLVIGEEENEEDGNEAQGGLLNDLRVCIATREIVGLVKNSGIATAFYELAKRLAANGARVTLLSLKEDTASDFEWWEIHYAQFGVRLVSVVSELEKKKDREEKEKGNTGQEDAIMLNAYPWGIRQAVWVHRFLLRHDREYDVVHFADNLGEGYFSLVSKSQGWAFQKTQFIIGLHGVQSWAQLLSKEFPFRKQSVAATHFERRALQLADIVVSPSRYMIEYLSRHGWKLPISKSIVIPNLNSVDSRTANSSSSSSPSLPVELIFYGRLEPRKGIDLMLGALELLGKRLQSSTSPLASPTKRTKITFLGRDLSSSRGPMGKWIMSQWQQSSWKDMELNIISDFERHQSLEYISPSSSAFPSGYRRLVVVPSLNENSPYTILECLTLSIPFIATRVGGIPELIDEEDVDRTTFEPTSEALFKKLLPIFLPTSASSHTAFIPARLSTLVTKSTKMWVGLHKGVMQRLKGENEMEKEKKENGKAPFVRVCVLPSKANARYLSQTIEALRRQTFKNFGVTFLFDGTNVTMLETLQRIASSYPEFQRTVDDSSRWNLLYLTSLEQKSGGLTRNLCTEQKGRKEDFNYVFFMQEEDIPQPGCLSRFVEVVEKGVKVNRRNNAILTSFAIEFGGSESPLEDRSQPFSPLPRLRAYFGGGDSAGAVSLAALDHNYLSASHLFVSRTAFELLGGFTTYLSECEVYEFSIRALLNHEVFVDVIPEVLIWSRLDPFTPGPPKDTVEDHFLCHYRATIPFLNDPRFADIADFLVFTRGVEKDSHSVEKLNDDTQVADSVRDFSGVQGQAGWFYGFFDCHSYKEFAASIHEVATLSWDPKNKTEELSPTFFFDNVWTHADSDESCPFVRKGAMCPYHKRGQVLCPFRAFRVSSCMVVTLRLKVALTRSETLCGDGIVVYLSVNYERVWQHTLYSEPGKNEQAILVPQRTVYPGDLISIVIDPLGESNCDSSAVHLLIEKVMPCDGQGVNLSQQETNQQIALLKRQRRTILADSAHDYYTPKHWTGTGNDGWSNGFYSFSYNHNTFQMLEDSRLVRPSFYDKDSQIFRLKEADEVPFIGKTLQQPLVTRNATVTSVVLTYRRYTVTKALPNSVVRVRIDADPNPCGDGVLALLRLNSEYVIWWSVVGGGEKEYTEVTFPISLEFGDSLELIIDPRSNSDCDSTMAGFTLARRTSSLPSSSTTSPLLTATYPPPNNDTWKEFTKRNDKEITTSFDSTSDKNMIPFVMLFNIRSGSTWLVSMLRQIPGILCEEELLWHTPSDPIEVITDFYSRSRSRTPSNFDENSSRKREKEVPLAIGFKSAFSQWSDQTLVFDFLAGKLSRRKMISSLKIIHLKRKNRIKVGVLSYASSIYVSSNSPLLYTFPLFSSSSYPHALQNLTSFLSPSKAIVSSLRAESEELMKECGIENWHLAHDKKRREDCHNVGIRIDPTELLDWIRRRTWLDGRLEQLVEGLRRNGREVLELTYEDLLADPRRGLEQILRFLFSSPSSSSSKKNWGGAEGALLGRLFEQIDQQTLLKITDDDLRKVISNFEEIEKTLKGNPHQEMLYRDVEYFPEGFLEEMNERLRDVSSIF